MGSDENTNFKGQEFSHWAKSLLAVAPSQMNV